MPSDQAADRIALQDLMLNYAAGVDERDFERYKACFAEHVEVFNFGAQTFHGLDAWLDYVWEALENYSSTQHLLGPQLATIEGNPLRRTGFAFHQGRHPEKIHPLGYVQYRHGEN